MLTYTESALQELSRIIPKIKPGCIIQSSIQDLTVLELLKQEEYMVLVYAYNPKCATETRKFSAVIISFEKSELIALNPCDYYMFFNNGLRVLKKQDAKTAKNYAVFQQKVDRKHFIRIKKCHEIISVKDDKEEISFQFIADTHMHREKLAEFWMETMHRTVNSSFNLRGRELQETSFLLLLIKNFLDYSKITPVTGQSRTKR